MVLDDKPKSVMVEEGLNLLAQGRRNLLCRDFQEAVCQLGKATQILAQEYGDMGSECADAYSVYGRALLELHRTEGAFLGDAIPKDKIEDVDEDEDEEEEEQNGGTAVEGGESEEKEDEKENKGETNGKCAEKCSSKGEDDEKMSGDKKKGDGGDDDGEKGESDQKDEGGEKNDDGEKNDEEEEEEVSNLQLAWEVLELAKVIFSKDDSAGSALKLAETHFKLGEVGLESEQLEGAIGDFEVCLRLQKEHLPLDCRLLAETHYQVAITHHLMAHYKPALDHFLTCIQVLQMRVGRLEKEGVDKKVEGGDDVGGNEGGSDVTSPKSCDVVGGGVRVVASNEVKELKELIKEVYLKIEEVRDEEKLAPQVSEMITSHLSPSKKQLPVGDHGEGSQTLSNPANVANTCPSLSEFPLKSTATVNNITHMVRKKRKADVEESINDAGQKKSKIENVDDKK